MPTIKRYLPGEDISEIMQLRLQIFCDEQGYPRELESDEYDSLATHLAIFEGEELVACGRVAILKNGHCKLGRIAVKRSLRGQGIGRLMVNELINEAKSMGYCEIHISAQTHAVPFYERFGFVAYGTEFQDENIPHVHMIKNTVFDSCSWLEFAGEDAVLYKRCFTLPKIKSAKLTICGLGFFELFFNGKRYNDDLFVPAFSNYEKQDMSKYIYPIYDTLTNRIYYMEYDVTSALKEGKNCMGVHIGAGWYGDHIGKREGVDRYGQIKLCYRLDITTADGQNQSLVSDQNGGFIKSFVTRPSIYFGEHQDLRLYDADWSCYREGESLYSGKEVKPVNAVLCRQDFPADREIKRLYPVLIKAVADKKIYDIGENTSGYAVLKFSDTAVEGDAVSVAYSEILDEELMPDYSTVENECIDIFIYSKKAKELPLYPKFSFKAGRYIEVTGKAEVEYFSVVHSPMPITAEFDSSDESLNWLFDAFIRTQCANTHNYIPSDCPHREKLGYTGDGQLCCRAVMTCFDAKTLYKKWLVDIADSQDRFNGHVQHTAPFRGGGGGPGGWGGAIVFVPMAYYDFYGEKSVLEDFLPKMEKYLEYMESCCENGIVVREEKGGWCLGDWCTPESVAIPPEFVNTYFLIKAYNETARAAVLLGLSDKALLLSKRADEHKSALCQGFYDESKKSFCDGIQGADAFAVDIDLNAKSVFETLCKKYELAESFDTGIFGTDVLIRCLFRNGRADLAIKLLTSKKEASFYTMLKSGATTIWETWSGKRSNNHPMFGAVVEYLFSDLLGIRKSDVGQGLDSYSFAADYDSPLEYVRGSISTPFGKIKLERRFGKIITAEKEKY